MFNRLMRRSGPQFRTRGPERDQHTDQGRLQAVKTAIEGVIADIERERDGLDQRLKDVLGRASLAVGTGSDDYQEREVNDGAYIKTLEDEVVVGQQRLAKLNSDAVNYRFIRAALLSRFGPPA